MGVGKKLKAKILEIKMYEDIINSLNILPKIDMIFFKKYPKLWFASVKLHHHNRPNFQVPELKWSCAFYLTSLVKLACYH